MRLEVSARSSGVLLAVGVGRVSGMQVLRWEDADELLIRALVDALEIKFGKFDQRGRQ
jgi:hypothetical protein